MYLAATPVARQVSGNAVIQDLGANIFLIAGPQISAISRPGSDPSLLQTSL